MYVFECRPVSKMRRPKYGLFVRGFIFGFRQRIAGIAGIAQCTKLFDVPVLADNKHYRAHIGYSGFKSGIMLVDNNYFVCVKHAEGHWHMRVSCVHIMIELLPLIVRSIC